MFVGYLHRLGLVQTIELQLLGWVRIQLGLFRHRGFVTFVIVVGSPLSNTAAPRKRNLSDIVKPVAGNRLAGGRCYLGQRRDLQIWNRSP